MPAGWPASSWLLLRAAAQRAPLVPLAEAAALVLAAGTTVRTVVLVEGHSDARAVRATARLLGRDLDAEGTAVAAMGGATNLRHFLALFGPSGVDLQVRGLCDEQEARHVAGELGLAGDAPLEALSARGFAVCVADLEDELVRALGSERVEEVLAQQGELGLFRTFQHQPAQRQRSAEAQLRRFLGTRSGRKVRYGELLVDALTPDSVPAPLVQVVEGEQRQPPCPGR